MSTSIGQINKNAKKILCAGANVLLENRKALSKGKAYFKFHTYLYVPKSLVKLSKLREKGSRMPRSDAKQRNAARN